MARENENNPRVCSADGIYIHTVRQSGKLCGQEDRFSSNVPFTDSIKPSLILLLSWTGYPIPKNLTFDTGTIMRKPHKNQLIIQTYDPKFGEKLTRCLERADSIKNNIIEETDIKICMKLLT